jgi:hypothetical protein
METTPSVDYEQRELTASNEIKAQLVALRNEAEEKQ